MKCPKCDYLAFETGNRCRNCGYDFSLMPPDHGRQPSATRQPQRPSPIRATGLPLFTAPGEDDDDEPLIRLPVAPRPPLAVRKTPDSPRQRSAPRSAARPAVDPVLFFPDETAPAFDLPLHDPAAPGAGGGSPAAPVPPSTPAPAASAPPEAAADARARLGAAVLDHVILLAIDAAVVYFTLRMAALAPAEWRLLPPAPLFAFLALLKLAYFFAFTALGGQTIGKMAFNIRVVADRAGRVDAARAARRTLAGALSSAALGLGFVPALVGSERRALHDRFARTRVVPLRAA
jgi:uncharacterized RDD family membrane protein YckC